MSRSNPTDTTPNPSTRWFEWSGGSDGGTIRYYDKELKKNVDVGDKFQFILLDELACVKGWHDASDSGIFSNEVRDTKQDVMVVRAFKGGDLATGVYSSIRDRVQAMGGHFVASCYVAIKSNDGSLSIANIGFKGAALNAWVEFKKACPNKIVNGKSVRGFYTDAICINGFLEGKKGKVVYRTPCFSLLNLSQDSNAAAIKLDAILQQYLSIYLARPKIEQTQQAEKTISPDEVDDRTAMQVVSRQVTHDDFEDAAIPF